MEKTNLIHYSLLSAHGMSALTKMKIVSLLHRKEDVMTGLQAEYSKLLESKRHNQAEEMLTADQNATQRFVAATGRMDVEEKQRHNLATETLSAKQLDNDIRRQQRQDEETMRHNHASEDEIKRHNLAVENQAKADNKLKAALAALDNATKVQISNAQLANDKWKTQYTTQVDKALKEAELAMKKYETDTKALLESNRNDLTAEQNQIRRAEVLNGWKKIKSDIEYTSSKIQNDAAYRKIAEAQEKRKALLDEQDVLTKRAQRAKTWSEKQKIDSEIALNQKQIDNYDKIINADVNAKKSNTARNYIGAGRDLINTVRGLLPWNGDSEGMINELIGG
jgi:hypothetical protein